jgi:hypothetical protein
VIVLGVIIGAIIVFGIVYFGVKDIAWMRREHKRHEGE